MEQGAEHTESRRSDPEAWFANLRKRSLVEIDAFYLQRDGCLPLANALSLVRIGDALVRIGDLLERAEVR